MMRDDEEEEFMWRWKLGKSSSPRSTQSRWVREQNSDGFLLLRRGNDAAYCGINNLSSNRRLLVSLGG